MFDCDALAHVGVVRRSDALAGGVSHKENAAMPMPAVFHIGRVREALRGARQASPRGGVPLGAHAAASCLADKK
ncbi:protein of unknown function [Ralstonia solanacearum CMR15]|nr:protein of unknown function [Ralstonia solanacearum CMR15]